MTTTELIELLKKHERGGATGRPREVMFEVDDRIIDTDGIEVTGSGDGLISELYLSLPSAQPEQIARDIATIIENERDMRVILKNADRTETHSCDYQRTVTHDWIPVTERVPDVRQWVLCQCRANIMDVLRLTDDGSWYRKSNEIYMSGFVLAWMPLPEPWKGEKHEL